jgi:hypothetical protein
MSNDDNLRFIGQVLYDGAGWVDVIRAATLREAARASAIAYHDHNRRTVGVRVIDSSRTTWPVADTF